MSDWGLVVDDHALARSVHARLLSRLDLEQVHVACDGLQALELVQRWGAPAVALVDLHMPGMGGQELLERLRRSCPQLPVVVVTGDGSELVHEQALLAGAREVLVKPVDVVALTARLRELLDERVPAST